MTTIYGDPAKQHLEELIQAVFGADVGGVPMQKDHVRMPLDDWSRIKLAAQSAREVFEEYEQN